MSSDKLLEITHRLSHLDPSLGMQGVYNGTYFFVHSPHHLKIKISQDSGANVPSTTLIYMDREWKTIIYLPDPRLGHRSAVHNTDQTMPPIITSVPKAYLEAVIEQIQQVDNWMPNFIVV